MVWVNLAPLSDPALVPSAVATTLGLDSGSDRPILDTLVLTLHRRQLLLLLDNCEHVLDCTGPRAVANGGEEGDQPGEGRSEKIAGAVQRGSFGVRCGCGDRRSMDVSAQSVGRVLRAR